MATIDSYLAVTFVSDADTPAASLPYAGKTYYLPPDLLTAYGTGPGSPGYIDGIRGYMRLAADGVSHEWLMTDLLDATLRNAIRDIPGGSGWVDTNQRQVYRQQARRLIGLGVTAPDVADIENLLYDAAVLNYIASPH